MKSADLFEDFEKLLLSKEYEQLNEAERNIIFMYCSGPQEYSAMRLLMQQSQTMAAESNTMTPPSGGAEQVWARSVMQNNINEKPHGLNRSISIWWAVGLAAALILSWLIRFPAFTQKEVPMLIPDVSPRLITEVKTDTVIKEVPVYIHPETQADTCIPESSNDVVSYGGMVYVQPVSSVDENKIQRQGTNASEMGDLAKMQVTVY